MNNLPPLNPSMPPPATLSKLQEQFLRFSVGYLTALLPVLQLAKVLTITTDEIVPIPHMPAWVRGVYNWRGEILWMIDLRNSLGLPSWHPQASLQAPPSSALETAIVVQSRAMSNARSQILGLVVDRVEDIEWCQSDSVQSLPCAPEIPFLQGYWTKPSGEKLAVFDGEAIIAAMPKAD